MRRATLLIALMVGFLGLVAARADDSVFVGYVFGSTRGIDYKLYTHLFHAFLLPNADGSLKADRNVPNPDFVAEAHKAGVKVVVSLGGWGYDEQFAAIAKNPEAENRLVEEVMAIVEKAGYDGVDLDWEYPDTKDEVAGFERVVRRFHAELEALDAKRGSHLVLTMAASSNPGTLRWLDRDFLVETMDWVNVMTYDYAGEWSSFAGHHSPLFGPAKAPENPTHSTERTLKFLVEERKIPADRLAVGIPLYGRGFPVAEPYASTKGVPRKRLPQGDYRNLMELQKDGWTRSWDDQSKNPWLTAPDKSAVIGYDDPESAAIKAEWAKKQGFRGVFFWQVAGDRMEDGSHPVQEAAKRAWSK